MLKIRLRRVGAKKQPSYRIVVAESTSPRDGRFLEVIGHYNPRTEPETVSVNAGRRAAYWISVGAQPTRAVERLLRKGGAYDANATAVAPAAVAEPAPSAPAVTPEAPAAPAITPSEG